MTIKQLSTIFIATIITTTHIHSLAQQTDAKQKINTLLKLSDNLNKQPKNLTGKIVDPKEKYEYKQYPRPLGNCCYVGVKIILAPIRSALNRILGK